MAQTKPNHKEFLDAVGTFTRRIEKKPIKDNSYLIFGQELNAIIGHSKWLAEWLDQKATASASRTKFKGAKRKPVAELKPESLKRRRARDAAKKNNLTTTTK